MKAWSRFWWWYHEHQVFLVFVWLAGVVVAALSFVLWQLDENEQRRDIDQEIIADLASEVRQRQEQVCDVANSRGEAFIEVWDAIATGLTVEGPLTPRQQRIDAAVRAEINRRFGDVECETSPLPGEELSDSSQ